MKVAFDFDDTLDRKDVQEYATQLVDRGLEVWIVTARNEDPTKYSKEQLRQWGIIDPVVEQEYLFAVANKCGIKRENIKFTNMEYKDKFFTENPGFVFLLDDNYIDLQRVNSFTRTVGISSLSGAWKNRCERLLKRVKNDYRNNRSH